MMQRIYLGLAAIIRWLRGLQPTLRWLAVYMAMVGLVTFPLFIHEEALQTIMFGTWQAANADRFDIIAQGADMMDKVNSSMKTLNYVFGWVNPLSFLSYRAYGHATDYYIEASRAKIMRRAPHLMVGLEAAEQLKPSKVERLEDGRWLASDGNVGFVSENEPKLNQPVLIEGVYALIDGRLIIQEK